MASDESGKDPNSEESGTQYQLLEYAWPMTVGVSILVVIALFWFSTKGHDHISQGRFVGPEICKECHEEQYDSWRGTRMANSFDVLLPGEKIEEKQMVGLDPDFDYSGEGACLPCHTTGYGLVGGFVSIEETPEMVGVSCEACHGHGGAYVNTVMDPRDPSFRTDEARDAGLIYPPSEVVCRECHNESSPFVGMDYDFDFDERVSLGTHQHFQLKYEHSR